MKVFLFAEKGVDWIYLGEILPCIGFKMIYRNCKGLISYLFEKGFIVFKLFVNVKEAYHEYA